MSDKTYVKGTDFFGRTTYSPVSGKNFLPESVFTWIFWIFVILSAFAGV